MKKAIMALVLVLATVTLFSAIQFGFSATYNRIDAYLIANGCTVGGFPCMKLNFGTGSTYPLVPVSGHVRRTDAVAGTVLVYVAVTGTTLLGHTEEWGYTTQLMDPGDDLLLAPILIADPAPLVGTYNCSINPYVLADNAVNTNVGGAQNYNLGWFKMLGYCDLNADNVVDGKDYVLVKKAVGSLPGGAKWNWAADVNCSNSVTASDYQLVKTHIPTVYTPN